MDYKNLGLKVGIEIHQRLDTKKLFCNCESGQKDVESREITRKLRPVAGELGVIDPAALHEYFKNRSFVYKLYPSESCEVETDEEPPHDVNNEALHVVLQICKLLNANVVDEIHFMRKTVIDGSNTGGFQRTAIIGMDGFIETSFGRVAIPTICLEEEAARIESEKDGVVTYKLNGLAIPLVETTTNALASTPDEALELAYKIGSALRTTKIQRGIGSIRQDVNISIKEGSRIEIKGFQEIRSLPELVEKEVARQLALIEIKNQLANCGFKEISEKKNVTQIFEKTECKFLADIIKNNEHVFALVLPKFAGLLKKDCGGHSFGKELAYYAESYGPKGIIHSDEDVSKYKLEREFSELKRAMNAGNNDVVLIVAGHGAEKAIHAIRERVLHCMKGVPKETRIALPDASSRYARPLPGSDRMYPETDVMPISITEKDLASVVIPETLEERKAFLKSKLPEELTNQMLTSEYYDVFKNTAGYDPILVANTLLSTMKNLKRQNVDVSRITKEQLEEIFRMVKEKRISKTMIPNVLADAAKNGRIDAKKIYAMTDNEIEKIADKIFESAPAKKMSVLMGMLMKETEGRVHPEKAAEIIKKKLEKKKK